MNGKGLAEESKLYRKLKKMYKQNGDNKETFLRELNWHQNMVLKSDDLFCID